MEGENSEECGLWKVRTQKSGDSGSDIRSVAVWSGQGKDNVTDCQ